MLEPFVLPPSKLAPPRISVALLRRPHLLDVLHRSLARRLVLLTAEAGYGKTSLLISALDGIEGPVAWLTLDERDTDPSLFGCGPYKPLAPPQAEEVRPGSLGHATFVG